jgi:hypothetical protein
MVLTLVAFRFHVPLDIYIVVIAAYNLTRVMNIVGTKPLMAAIAT